MPAMCGCIAPLGVGGARPDLVIAVRRQLQGRGPALPVVLVLRLARAWRAARSRRNRSRHRPAHRVLAGPRGAAQLQLARAGRQLRAVRRAGDDRAHRHRLQDAEVLRVALVARHHRLDRHAVGELRHARAVVLLVAQPDPGQPLVRRRARPAGNDQPHRPAVDVRQRLAVHRPDDQLLARPSPSRAARRATASAASASPERCRSAP